MSDEEDNFVAGGSGAPGDDELSLPRATVQKLISETLPKEMICAKETRDILIDCCIEFIRLVSSEANEVCEKSAKKTIAPEHVVTALKELGFETFIGDIEEVLKEHNTQVKDRERKMSRMEHSGYSAEELQRQQEMLFAASRARYEASN